MSSRGKSMPYEERLWCIEQKKAGKTNGEIALEIGWSESVVRKWWRVYQKKGEIGLSPKMGRPRAGALSTFSPELRSHVEQVRTDKPGWGPITLLEELKGLPGFSKSRLPSRARIAAFLKEKGLVRKYKRHAGFPATRPEAVKEPHDEWEMDAQGRQTVTGLGEVCVINIVDVISHLKVESYPHFLETSLRWQDYQLTLRRAFTQYGLPKQITLDHDTVFFDNTSRSPYPSRLHLWLVALGVPVIFIEKRPPLQHAMVERGHQTMTAQTIIGQIWTSQSLLWQELDKRREFLNNTYPSRTLSYRAPLEVFPAANHSRRYYRPEWEEESLDLNRIYTFLADGRWFRETNVHGQFDLGTYRYNAKRAAAHTTQEITFDSVSCQFCAKTVGTDNTQKFPAKGLTKADLMGESPAFARIPHYQQALSFSREVWRQNTLIQMTNRATTLRDMLKCGEGTTL